MSMQFITQNKSTFKHKCAQLGTLVGKKCAFLDDYDDQILKRQIIGCGGKIVNDDKDDKSHINFLIYDASAKPLHLGALQAFNDNMEIISDSDFYNNVINGSNPKIIAASNNKQTLACTHNGLITGKNVAFYRKRGFANIPKITKHVDTCEGIIIDLKLDHMNTKYDFIVYKEADKDDVKVDPAILDYLKSKPHKKTIVVSDSDFLTNFINGAKKTLFNLPFRAKDKLFKDKHFY